MTPRTESELIDQLRAKPDSLRIRAAKELALIGGAAAVPALREALVTEHPLLRVMAGFALWRIARDREGLDAVLDALASASPDASVGAVYALGAMGAEIIPVLEAFLVQAPERRDIARILEELRHEAAH